MDNLSYNDFSMIHRELNSFLKFKDEVIKKYSHVQSYKELLLRYSNEIEKFKKESPNIEKEIEILTLAILDEDIEGLK
jgi:hypothetical protein